MRESGIENKMGKVVKDAGGLFCKWGENGWPDRLCIMPDGRTIYLEVKRPEAMNENDVRTKRQHRRHDELRARGHAVWVCCDTKDFTERLRAMGYGV